MRTFGAITALLGVLASAAQAEAKEEPLVLPSGLEAILQEVIEDPSQPTYRFRYVAQDFDNQDGLEIVSADLDYLCAEHALPALSARLPDGVQIVVSLADMPSPFGVYDPAVTQVFEAYRVEDGRCIWEAF